MSAAPNLPERFGKVRPAFLDRVESRKGKWPKRDSFCRWMRDDKALYGSWERHWASLQEGRPVPWVMIECLAEHARKNWRWDDVFPCTIAEEAAPELPGAAHSLWVGNGGWASLAGLFVEQFGDHDEMYVKKVPQDLHTAASLIARCVARKSLPNGCELDDDTARREGEAIMGRSVEANTAWLRMLLHQDHRAVMFPVIPPRRKADGEGPVRAGVVVSIPLSEAGFDRFLSGKAHDSQLTAADIQSPSQFVFVNAMAAPESLSGVSQYRLSAAQAHCLLYQWAWFTRRGRQRELRPTIVTIETNPEYAGILRRFGYSETGACMHGTNFKIMALRRVAVADSLNRWRGFVAYNSMRFLLRLFQVANRNNWRGSAR